MKVNRYEIYRYMGVRGEADERTRELVEDCLRELEMKISPRSFAMEYPVTVAPDDTIDMTCFRVQSHNLGRNLRGCEKVILFAATIGEGADLLIRRYSRVNVSRALAMQASSAAMIEAYCNEQNQRYKEDARARGYFLRPRFSPGYGDFPLEKQRILCDVLKTEKTVGIKLTGSLLMMPSKSVTAVIGMSRHEEPCIMEGCEACGKKDCAFRR
jgi:hypothetical protein